MVLGDAKEIYKHAYKLKENIMLLRRNVLILFLYLLFFMSINSGASEVLLNGTGIYLASGDSYGLYQGYVLNLKSVSGDGSVWFQLTEKDKIVKSDIVHDHGYFIYNKTNSTILSVKIDKVYSGPSEQNLVSLIIYQYTDPDLPAPIQIGTTPVNPPNPDNNNNLLPRIQTSHEPVIWALGIVFVLILFYILRKLW